MKIKDSTQALILFYAGTWIFLLFLFFWTKSALTTRSPDLGSLLSAAGSYAIAHLSHRWRKQALKEENPTT